MRSQHDDHSKTRECIFYRKYAVELVAVSAVASGRAGRRAGGVSLGLDGCELAYRSRFLLD